VAQSIGRLLYLLFYVAILVLCVWALVDATRRPAGGFVAAGKRTKQFWTWILVAATFLALAAVVGSGIPFLGFLTLLAAVAAIVYLVDVKPALGPSGRGPRGGGPRRPPSSTGGW
jgi:hypothetical protein